MNQMATRVAAVCLASMLTLALPASAQPPEAGTAAAVKQLSTLLVPADGAPGPRFIAAEDPADATRFVAAMLLPDLQLLVVSAAYSAPVLLRERVLTRKYRDAYQDLQAASEPDGKIVIEDLLANGLFFKPAKGQAADAATLDGKAVTFDGQWRKAKLKEEEYTAAFEAAEKAYTRLLGLLVTQAKLR